MEENQNRTGTETEQNWNGTGTKLEPEQNRNGTGTRKKRNQTETEQNPNFRRKIWKMEMKIENLIIVSGLSEIGKELGRNRNGTRVTIESQDSYNGVKMELEWSRN